MARITSIQALTLTAAAIALTSLASSANTPQGAWKCHFVFDRQ